MEMLTKREKNAIGVSAVSGAALGGILSYPKSRRYASMDAAINSDRPHSGYVFDNRTGKNIGAVITPNARSHVPTKAELKKIRLLALRGSARGAALLGGATALSAVGGIMLAHHDHKPLEKKAMNTNKFLVKAAEEARKRQGLGSHVAGGAAGILAVDAVGNMIGAGGEMIGREKTITHLKKVMGKQHHAGLEFSKRRLHNMQIDRMGKNLLPSMARSAVTGAAIGAGVYGAKKLKDKLVEKKAEEDNKYLSKMAAWDEAHLEKVALAPLAAAAGKGIFRAGSLLRKSPRLAGAGKSVQRFGAGIKSGKGSARALAGTALVAGGTGYALG